MRVIASHPVRPSTRITEFSLRPNRVAMTMASTMYGIANRMSVIRMAKPSSAPPKKPAAAPKVTPMTSEMTVARMPIRKEIRAP
jgi:hypothetical protein